MRPRPWLGLVLAVSLPGLLTAALLAARPTPSLGLISPLYILSAVVVALVGGLGPAVLAAILSSLLANFFFVPPVGTLEVADAAHVAELAVTVLVAAVVALLMDGFVRRTAAAERAQAEASALVDLSQWLLGVPDQLTMLLERAVGLFGAKAAAVVGPGGRVTAATPSFAPLAVSLRTPAGEGHELVLQPPQLDAERHRLFTAFGQHAGAILRREELEASAATADALARDNRARTALLSAVSHDLRTPLAGIKAAIGGLRSSDVELSREDVDELHAVIDDSTERLDDLIGNLLAMSRLQAGAVVAHPRPVDLGEVLPATVGALSEPDRAAWTLDPEARHVVADAGLLERVLGNVGENALRFQPVGAGPIRIGTTRTGERVEIRVTDAGPGVPDEMLDRIFQPFQRYGDAPSSTGVGLGLAVARGLMESMGGDLRAEHVASGGLCLVASLPAADGRGGR